MNSDLSQTGSSCELVQSILLENGLAGLSQNVLAHKHFATCPTCSAFSVALLEIDQAALNLPTYDASEQIVSTAILSAQIDPKYAKIESTEIKKASKFISFEYIKSKIYQKLVRTSFIIFICLMLFNFIFEFWDSPLGFVGLLGFLEGSSGALIMVAAAVFTILSVSLGRYRAAIPLFATCIAVFTLRSFISTFFSIDVDIADYEQSSAKEQMAYNSQPVYNDERILDGGRSIKELLLGKSSSTYETPYAPKTFPVAPQDDRVDSPSVQEKKMKSDNELGIRNNAERQDTFISDKLVKKGELFDEKNRGLGGKMPADLSVQEIESNIDSDIAIAELNNLKPQGSLSQSRSEETSKDKLRSESFARRKLSVDPQKAEDSVQLSASIGVDQHRALKQIPITAPNSIAHKNAILAQFLEERANISNLKFKEPQGYWQNTYIPGDPALLSLSSSLRGNKVKEIEQSVSIPMKLWDGVRQNSQPFDQPQDAALSVFLTADASGVEGPRRSLLQVGIKATDRQSGSRPAMRLAIVLDLSKTPDASVKQQIEALILSFSKARQVGDRFSLVVAGRSGGTIIPEGDFLYGTVTVAMQQLFRSTDSTHNNVLTLLQAFQQASQSLVSDENSNVQLGSRSVVVIAPQRLGSVTEAFAQMAHSSAVAGVPVSLIGVGDEIELAELDQVALAGQGNRRSMNSITQAAAVVDRELLALSRVVARAVRLNIRLAPGVKLIDVIGSKRLDQYTSDQIKAAEKSIDKRISRTLGIASDRGDDEDGIQIVIPAFYAGDAHPILLDVVVAGAGPVAEVTARYKDLVFMRNGVAKAALTLGNQAESSAALNSNVLKNFLTHRTAASLRSAGSFLSKNDIASAISLVQNSLLLLDGMRSAVPGLLNDADITRDLVALKEFQQVLVRYQYISQEQQMQIAQGLKLSGLLKVLPKPKLDE